MTATTASTMPAAPAGGSAAPAPPPRRWSHLGLAMILALAGAMAIGPRPPSLSPETAGDEALAAELRAAIGGGRGFDTLAVAAVGGAPGTTGAPGTSGGEIRTAGLGGAGGETPFELGSITKAITGMLLADLVDDGVVALDDTLGELLPDVAFADPDLAATTLEQLATHRSGLPRDVPGHYLGRFGQMVGADPFGELSPQDMLDAAATAEVGEREVAYSNFGFALLGQALAERTGTSYRDLLRARVLDPLGMDDTVVVAPGEPLPPEAQPGRSAGGTLMAPWRGWGMAPAGGAVWSTAGDLGRLLEGVADGTAPGADAAESRADYREGARIGLGWITSTVTTPDGERSITSHNGATGGYRTWAGFDPDSGDGVAVLSSTARPVDAVGERLLGAEEDRPGPDWIPLGLTLFFSATGAAGVFEALPSRRGKGRPRDRLRAPAAVASSLVLLWVAHLAGAWHVVPPAVWTIAVAVFAVGLVRLAAWWPRLPPTAGASRTRRVASTALSLAGTAALAGFLWASV